MSSRVRSVTAATLRTVSLLSVTVACQLDRDWGDPELQARVSALGPEAVVAKIHDRPGRPPADFPPDLLDPFLRGLAALPAAESIGKAEGWFIYCEIRLRAGSQESLEASLGTRESLAGRIVLILQETRNANPRMGFYEGEAMFGWLEEHSLCTRRMISTPQGRITPARSSSRQTDGG